MSNNVVITEEVILTIASIAAKEVEGVAGLHSGVVDSILDKMKVPTFNGGVSATTTEASVAITVSINVFYGEKINEVAKKVQENIKNSIETMTDKEVVEVNVHVHGVTVNHFMAEK